MSSLSDVLQLFHFDGSSQDSSGDSSMESFFERVGDFFRHFTDHLFHAHHDCPPSQPGGGGDDTGNPITPSGGDGHCSGSSNNNSPGDGSQCAVDTDDGNHTNGWWLGASNWTNPDCPPLCNLPGVGGTDTGHGEDEQTSSQSDLGAAQSDQRLGSNLAQLVQAMAGHLASSAALDAGSNSHIAADPAAQTVLTAAWHQ
jgi:hypothetical protein